MKLKTLVVGATLATTVACFGIAPLAAPAAGTGDGSEAVHAAYALESGTDESTVDDTSAVVGESAAADSETEPGSDASGDGSATTPGTDGEGEGEAEGEPETDPEGGDEEAGPVVAVPSIALSGYVQGQGWSSTATATPGQSVLIGTVKQNLLLEALKSTVTFDATGDDVLGASGVLEIDVRLSGGQWQGWKSAGAVSGYEGQGKRIEAVRMRLSGDVAEYYDVYYRVSTLTGGWMPWTLDGEVAGTSGFFTGIDAVEVKLVRKDVDSGLSTGSASLDYTGLRNRAYVRYSGWQGYAGSGSIIGVTGSALEALQLNACGYAESGGIQYRSYLTGSGWQAWAADGAASGKENGGVNIEAIQISLTGDLAAKYDIYYRVYESGLGWMGWTKNGGSAGSQGFGKRVEAVEIRIVRKGMDAPATGENFLGQATLNHRGYVKNSGWESWSTANTIGSAGSGKALTGFQFNIQGAEGRPSGSVLYRVCDINNNWGSWLPDDKIAGSENGTALSAVQMNLNGDMLKYYDIYYRAYITGIGWLGWVKNGASAGCGVGGAYTLESVEYRLVLKGASAPGSTANPYISSSTAKWGWQNPSGYYQVSRFNVTLAAAAYNTPFCYVTPSRISLTASRQDCINAFVARAYDYLGTAYVWNYSRQPGVGVDCIGLVYQCAYATGMDMGEFNPYDHYYSGTNGWHSHDAMNVWNYGKIQRLSFSQRQYGDLIFYPGHVAIYLGNNKIIEASSISGKVVISSVYRYSTIYGVGRLYV
jgi:uncharacterized protein YjdB/cell wall-associated NlpC family hydrolase